VSNGLMPPKSDCILHPVDFLRVHQAWSKHGIGCNALAPGFFPTELTAAVFNNPERAAGNAAQTAIGRNGELRDLEGITIFLASSASDYITGQTIYLDGGFTAK